MFSQDELDRLIDAMRASQVTALTVENDGETLHLKLAQSAPVRPPSQMPTAEMFDQRPVKSGAIGRFVARGGDDGLDPLVPTSPIAEGCILGYISQGHTRVPVTAPVQGRLACDAPQVGTIFGYGDVVFELEVSP